MSDDFTSPPLWPAFNYDEIAPTVDYIHRLSQIAAKYTLDKTFERNWGHIVLDVTPRGFATPLLRSGDVIFAVEFAPLDREVSLCAPSCSVVLHERGSLPR